MGAETRLNAQGQRSTAENFVLVTAPASCGQTSGAPGNVEQDHEEDAPLSQDAKKRCEYLIGVQVAYFRVCLDHTVATSGRLLQQAYDVLVAHYPNNRAEADTTVIWQQSSHSAGSSQVQQDHRVRGFNNMVPSVHQQETVAPVMGPTLRLIDVKGKVAASCADCNGSCFVQQATIEEATPEEIVMVFKEILPYLRTPAVDLFGNHAVQKILEHGPRSCKREVISNLIGHMFPQSLDKHSCNVIQKAFDVGEHDQKEAAIDWRRQPCGLGADMSFCVDGEDFAAHRCVLAVRSPVVLVELFSAMKEAGHGWVVEIHDMREDVFKNLQHLLVTTDRYGLDRLKLISEDILCRHINVTNAATMMAIADQHRCQELKEACFHFLKTSPPASLNAVMATNGFDYLAASCPAIIMDHKVRGYDDQSIRELCDPEDGGDGRGAAGGVAAGRGQ